MSHDSPTPEYQTPAAHEAGEPRREVPLYAKIMLALLIGGAIGLIINFANAAQTVSVAVDMLPDPAAGEPDPDRGEGFRLVQRKPYPIVDTLIDNVIEPIGKIFLRLVLMVVIPLVFSALALGVIGVGDVRRLG
ncbi:MAG TPA: cation:dicarboxylase symporter family transporter, partial [Pirellulaceae bacterium]|nr:cation:dicarboxylase symporter family transporter [Pirellulaceae bacterium]